MKNKLPSNTLAALIIIFSAGCSTVGYHLQKNNTPLTLQETAQSIDKAIPPLDTVLITLDNLLDSPSEEYNSRFDAYQSAILEFRKLLNIVDHDAQKMQVTGKTYFSNWELELSKIQNNQIESDSHDRMEDLAERFESINDRYATSVDVSAPLISNLFDIRTALGTDLTSGGIDSVRGLQKQLSRNGRALKEQFVNLSEDCKSLASDLSVTSAS